METSYTSYPGTYDSFYDFTIAAEVIHRERYECADNLERGVYRFDQKIYVDNSWKKNYEEDVLRLKDVGFEVDENTNKSFRIGSENYVIVIKNPL